jgi:peroxiredoxin
MFEAMWFRRPASKPDAGRHVSGEQAMVRFAIGAAAVLAAAGFVSAGEFNKRLNVGDAAPEWKDLDGVDGKKHSLANLKGKDAVVVVFTCNSCPVAQDYEDRIIAFANKHTTADNKVALVAINVNTVPDDRMPKMKERAEKKQFPYPYLFDPTQEIAKAYGANYTPEFFVLNKERKVVYLGAMDDKNTASEAKLNYLEEALTAALAGKPLEKGETLARGCKIRWNREK